jgi:hypothetical protein
MPSRSLLIILFELGLYMSGFSEVPHPATVFPLGGENRSQVAVNLGNGRSLEVRMSNLRPGLHPEIAVFDRTELWLKYHESNQLLFAEPSSWLEPKETGSWGLIGILDAKIRGQELEVLLCRSMVSRDMCMSLYRFQETQGIWRFATGTEIQHGTDSIHRSRVKNATLEERGKIKLEWADGTDATMNVEDDGVVMLDGKVFWPGPRVGKTPSPEMALEREEYRGGFKVGNEKYYPKLLRDMGVIQDGDKPAPPSVIPNPKTKPEAQRPPVKVADSAKLISPPPGASDLSWAWGLTLLVVIGLLVALLKRRT